jgi:hypothetical protein
MTSNHQIYVKKAKKRSIICKCGKCAYLNIHVLIAKYVKLVLTKKRVAIHTEMLNSIVVSKQLKKTRMYQLQPRVADELGE